MMCVSSSNKVATINSHETPASQLQAFNNSSTTANPTVSDDMSEDDDDSARDSFNDSDLITSHMASDEVQAQQTAA